MDLDFMIQNIVKALNFGDITSAHDLTANLLISHPNNETILLLYASIKIHLEQHQEAYLYIDKAIQQASTPDRIINMILQHLSSNKIDSADYIASNLIRKYPDNYNLMNILGVIWKHRGKFTDSITILTKATEMNSNDYAAWMNMGNVYITLQQYDNALECCNKVLTLNPQHLEAKHVKGISLMHLNRHAEAITIFKEALVIAPDNIKIMIDLCSSYYSSRDYEQALTIVNTGLSLFPDDINLLRTKAVVLRPMGHATECIQALESIIDKHPNDIQSVIALANAYYYSLGDPQNAWKYYKIAYDLDENNISLLDKMCNFLMTLKVPLEAEIDNLNRAYEIAKKLLKLSPSPITIAGMAQSIFLKMMDYDNYSRLGTPDELMAYWRKNKVMSTLLLHMARVKTMDDRLNILNAHIAWGTAAEEMAKKHPITHKVKKRLNSKKRIGIMSSDLRNHPVGYFAWPIIEHLDRSQFELYVYSSYPYPPGHIQAMFMENVDSFKSYREEPSSAIAQSIADDQLDILFELGGMTSHNNVDICAYKPAPIQVSWLGYPHSIGLPTTIDYIMLDPYINPQDSKLLIEKPFIMPETWVSLDKLGFSDKPITSKIPQDLNGYITFGTMSMPHKFTLETFAVWAKIMHAVPNSRFLYVRPEALMPALQVNFHKYMKMHGISAERISFAGCRINPIDYYNRIDIVLDTFPHTGGTTTCEALWMGVPVVNLVGPAFFERLGYSNLNNAGLGDLCAFDLNQYYNIAISLAADIERRRHLRQYLRSQIKNHPLGQPKRFAHNFGKLIKETV